MGKWLFLILLLVVVFAAVKVGRRIGSAKRADAPVVEDMIACSRCGVNLPRSEAFESGGRLFCCKDHGASGST